MGFVYCALVETGVVPPLGSDVPSTHRWGSASRSFAQQGLGMMVHDLSARLYTRVFSTFDAADKLIEEVLRFSKWCVEVCIQRLIMFVDNYP